MKLIKICEKHEIEKRYLEGSQKYQCDICNREKMAEYRLKHPEKVKKTMKECSQKRRDFVKIDRINNPDKYIKKIKPQNFCEKHKRHHVLNSDGSLSCSSCKIEYQQEYRSNDPRYIRNVLKRKLKKFGINEEIYLKLKEQSGNKCYICDKFETKLFLGKVIQLAIDHCHKTKKVRGLLCHFCNTAIGSFKDDTSLLKKAISYLEQHEH
jgi:hypothetical protein